MKEETTRTELGQEINVIISNPNNKSYATATKNEKIKFEAIYCFHVFKKKMLRAREREWYMVNLKITVIIIITIL